MSNGDILSPNEFTQSIESLDVNKDIGDDPRGVFCRIVESEVTFKGPLGSGAKTEFGWLCEECLLLHY